MKPLLNSVRHITRGAAGWAVFLVLLSQPADAWSGGWSYETGSELTSSGDFDGDGDRDAVVVHRASGSYRVGYRQPDNSFYWPDVRAGGIDDAEGLSVGRVLATNRETIVMAAADANRVNLLDASDTNNAATPVSYFPESIGPQAALVINVDGPSDSAFDDLLVCTSLNDPPNEFRLHAVRVDSGSYSNADTLVSSFTRFSAANRVELKTGLPDYAAGMVRAPSGRFRVYNVTNENIEFEIGLTGVDTNRLYVFGHFDSSTNLGQFVFYVPGDTNLTERRITEPALNTFSFGSTDTMSVSGSIVQVVMLEDTNQLAVVMDDGNSVAIYDYDGQGNLVHQQTLTPGSGQQFTGVIPLADTEFLVLSGEEGSDVTTSAEPYAFNGSEYVAAAVPDSLPTVSAASGRGNVMVFAGEPLVDTYPQKLTSLNVEDWSSSFRLTGAPGNIEVTNETDRGLSSGLGDPDLVDLGAAPAGSTHGLVNQFGEPFSVYNFDAALGEESAQLVINPSPGHYQQSVHIGIEAAPTSHTVYYRTSLEEDWDTFTTSFWVFADSTVFYYGLSTNGVDKTPILSGTYTFEYPPEELDSDGDGVPDYVELAYGLDPVNSGSDQDGDGLSDLEELLGGTDPTLADSDSDGYSDLEELGVRTDPLNDTEKPASQEDVLTGNVVRVEQNASFDLYITPLPCDGTTGTNTLVETNEQHRAYDVFTSLQAVHASTNIAGMTNNPSVCFDDIDIELEPELVVVTTPKHFDIATAHTNPGIGREMVGLFCMPEVDAVTVAYDYTNGTLSVEGSNWVSAATSVWAAVQRQTLRDNLTVYDTLIASLFECRIGEILMDRGLVTNDVSLFSFREGETGFIVPDDDDLLDIEKRGTNEWMAYQLKVMFTNFEDQVNNSGDASVGLLRDLTKEIYRLSSLSNDAAPGSYALPLDAIRTFLKDGVLSGAYSNQVLLSNSDLSNALHGAGVILSSSVARTVTTLDLEVYDGGIDEDCTTLYEVGSGTPWSLFDGEGRPYDFPETFIIVSGSQVQVTGFIDIESGGCSGSGMEVESINLTAIPVATGEDADGNLMPDDWENLVFGMTGGSSTNDSDNDGYSDLQEYLEGTDPTDGDSTPGVAAEDLSPPVVEITGTNGLVDVYWSWPTNYQGDFDFVIDCTTNLVDGFANTTNAIISSNAILSTSIPGELTDTNSYYRIGISLR